LDESPSDIEDEAPAVVTAFAADKPLASASAGTNFRRAAVGHNGKTIRTPHRILIDEVNLMAAEGETRITEVVRVVGPRIAHLRPSWDSTAHLAATARLPPRLAARA
jgi:hypothetical protein